MAESQPGSPKKQTSPKANITLNSDDEEEEVQMPERQDVFVCFTNEKDLRHYESIRVKAQYFTGIAVRVKQITPQNMENILKAIDIDNIVTTKEPIEEDGPDTSFVEDKNFVEPGVSAVVTPTKTGAEPDFCFVGGLPHSLEQHPCESITNLRIEDTRMNHKCTLILCDWMKKKFILKTFALIKVKFEEKDDFKYMMEAVQRCESLKKFSIQSMSFNMELHGQSLGKAITNESIQQLDVADNLFDHPKAFFEMCQPMLHQKGNINILKIRSILFTTLEVKVISYLLSKNKIIHTMDFSECIDDNRNNFQTFFHKFDANCNVRFLTLDNMTPDLSNCIEALGIALGKNKIIEVLNMRSNRIKIVQYGQFWKLLCKNKSLKKINIQKTECNDNVMAALGEYLEQPDLNLVDLDLSRNSISDVGTKTLCESLARNKSIKILNIEQNMIQSDGCHFLANYLSANKTLQELSLGGNKINNEGIIQFSRFLEFNKTLVFLDISRNEFNDQGFQEFALNIEHSLGITYLDVSKNKDISDEQSLITMAYAIGKNRALKTLDLTGIRLRKPFLKSHLETALKTNITLIEVIGKIPQGTLEGELLTNQLIVDKIEPCFHLHPKITKRSLFNFKMVDEFNTSFLDISSKPHSYIMPSFKFMTFHDVRAIDFTNTSFSDSHMCVLADYLNKNPRLYSIVLDENPFTDSSMQILTNALKRNTTVAHLAIRKCPNLSDKGLAELLKVIADYNMVLFQIDLDEGKFDEDLASQLIELSALNRNIQQKLKPKFINKGTYPDGRLVSQDFAQQQNNPWASETDKLPIQNEAIGNSLTQSGANMAQIMSQNRNKREQDEIEALNITWSRHVEFDAEAPIADCFKSVLKVYSIMKPDEIDLENQQLTDEHIFDLVEFLKDRDMVKLINLRRNMISDTGAYELADLINGYDQTLTDINLNRNMIGQGGGNHLLEAIHNTIRIENFQIAFGNQISGSMANAFEQELKANSQIKRNLKKELGQDMNTIKDVLSNKEVANKFKKMKYEIVDRGPEYMRCAVKTTHLLNVLNLSLPDNLLGFHEAQLIADLLRKDPPLRILNLTRNCFDHKAALLIGDSLHDNTHLKALDLSYNRLGDMGVRNVLYPLLTAGLNQFGVINQHQAIRLELSTHKTNAMVDEVKDFDLKSKQANCLEALNLKENYMTQESLRHVWMLLSVNEKIIVDISQPLRFNWNHPMQEKPTDSKLDKSSTVNLEDTQRGLVDDAFESEEEMEEEFMTEDQLEDKRAKESKAAMRRKMRKDCCNCFQKFVCFKDFNNLYEDGTRQPTFHEVCCWRYYRSRQNATLFKTSDTTNKQLESKFQVCITYSMLINYIMLCVCFAGAFLFLGVHDEKDHIKATLMRNYLILASYLLFTFVFETIVVIALNRNFHFVNNCSYVFLKLLTGLFRRTAQCVQAQAAGVLIKEYSSLLHSVGLCLFILLVISQFFSIKLIFASMRLVKKDILRDTERNSRMSQATSYEAIYSLLRKVSIRPNSDMKRQGYRLENLFYEDRDQNEITTEQYYYKPHIHVEDEEDDNCTQEQKFTKCQSCFGRLARVDSTRAWQLAFSSIPLFLAGVIGLMSKPKYVDIKELHVLLVVGILSICNQIVQILLQYPTIIINSTYVYDLAMYRLSKKQDVYDGLLGSNASIGDDSEIIEEDELDSQASGEGSQKKKKKKKKGSGSDDESEDDSSSFKDSSFSKEEDFDSSDDEEKK